MESRNGNGVDGTHKILDDDQPGANNQTCYQPNGEGMAVEPIGVKPEKDGGQGLNNPDAAEQLEVDGISGR